MDCLADCLRFAVWCQTLTDGDASLWVEEVLPPLDVLMVRVTRCGQSSDLRPHGSTRYGMRICSIQGMSLFLEGQGQLCSFF
jgi:hypothetical protein